MSSQHSYSEKELVSQLKQGNESAFTELYNIYSRNLYFNILSLVKDADIAEELLQDIFVTVWFKKESIGNAENFSSYLFAASRNRVVDFLRKLQSESDLYERIKAAAVEGYSYIEEAIFKKENAQLLHNAIESMPPQRKLVFRLVKIEGNTYKEVGELLGISLSTVKDHMANARQHIRDFLLSGDDHVMLWLCMMILFKGSQN